MFILMHSMCNSAWHIDNGGMLRRSSHTGLMTGAIDETGDAHRAPVSHRMQDQVSGVEH